MHIFISYAHIDESIRERIQGDLSNAGLTVWYDETGIRPGEPSWLKAIETAIENSECMLVILTPEAKNSPWVRKEAFYAQKRDKKLFWVLAQGDEQNAVPLEYIDAQWIDVRHEADYFLNMRKLIDTIYDFLQRKDDSKGQKPQLQRELGKPYKAENAVAHIKKLMPYDHLQIDLADFVHAEIEEAYRAFTSAEFFAKRAKIVHEYSGEQRVSELWKLYSSSFEKALHILVTLSWYGKEHQTRLLYDAIIRWTEKSTDYQNQDPWRYFPMISLLYVCGIAASYKANWPFIRATLVEPRIWDRYGHQLLPCIQLVGDEFIVLRQEVEEKKVQFEQNLHNWYRPFLQSVISGEESYNYAFDLFDLLLSVLYIAYNLKGRNDWYPAFMAVTNPRSWGRIYEFWRQGGQQGENWNLLSSGLFSNSRLKVGEALKAYVVRSQTYQQQMTYRIFPDFAHIYFNPTT